MTGQSDVTQAEAEAATGVAVEVAPERPATRQQMRPPSSKKAPAALRADRLHRGWDASHYQSRLDGAAAKTASEWGWLKSSEATSYADPTYGPFSASCTAAGLPWGPYHFFRQAGAPAAQAAYWKRCAGNPGHGGVLPMLDVEVDPCSEGFVDAVLAASDAAFGLLVALYTYDSFIDSHPWMRKYHGHRTVVVARYSTSPPHNAWDVWQDTDNWPGPGFGSHPDGDVTPDLSKVLIGTAPPTPQEADLTPAQEKLLQDVHDALFVTDNAKDPNGVPMNAHWTLAYTWEAVQKLLAQSGGGPVAGPAVLSDADVTRLAKAVAVELAARMQS